MGASDTKPAGEAIELGTMKPSMFIVSTGSALWSIDFRSCCAIPLGADCGFGRAVDAAWV